MGVVACALIMLLLASGCSPVIPPSSRPLPPGQGGVVVAIRPFPPEASRLAFRLRGISAVRADGTAIPLSLRITDLDAPAASRERRLAEAALPPGPYAGLSFEVASASIAGGEAASDLLPPREPVTVPVAFEVEKRRAVLLALTLDHRRAVGDGFAFTPSFTAEVPLRPAPELIGVATGAGSGEVTLFDKITGRLLGSVPTGRDPRGIVVDRERRRAYVAALGDDAVESIGLLEQAVLTRLAMRTGDAPLELALTPDGRTLLTANSGSDSVTFIDAIPLVETARVLVGNRPASVLVDRSGSRAYVFNSGASTITVLDIASRAVVGTVSTEAGPIRGHFDRSGEVLYVIHRSSPYMTLVDPLSLSVTNRVYVGLGATAIKIDSRTDRIYVAIGSADAIEVYDRASLLPVDSIPTDDDVSFLAIDDEGNRLYLVMPGVGEIRAVSIVGKEVAARVDAGDLPYGVALMGER